MNDDRLTETLAQILGWRPGPGRFIKADRRWIPRWRFRPLEDLGDAFQLLDVAASGYKLASSEGEMFTAKVWVRGRVGKASGESKARTITIAISKALGLVLPDEVTAPTSRQAAQAIRSEAHE